MSKPLLSKIGNTELLELYGEHRYSDIWTYNQAWAAGIRDWDRGNWESAAMFFGKLRQELLQIHKNLYPEDTRWM
jgi:hypothetical protein